MKRVLLMAGGGTLGTPCALELLRLGYQVDVIALEELHSLNRNLSYIRARIDDELLKSLFAKHHYDAIVDFLHYPDPQAYRKRAEMLLANTDQLVFMSSCRVYADECHIITEDSPQLLDVSKDEYLLSHETYAIPKAYNERFLRACGRNNWTIVRPMLSFSHFRLDLVSLGAPVFLVRALQGKKTILPADARYMNADIGYAENVGRMIARLIGREAAFGEAFTLGIGEKHTWDEVAGYYEEMLGAEFVWVGTEDYLQNATMNTYMDRCMLFHSRMLDRHADCSKVLRVTGIAPETLITTREAVIRELAYLSDRPDLMKRFDTENGRIINARMDAYLNR